MFQTNEDRPPFVKFEMRPKEDRDASLAAGHYVARDVPFAIVTPPGGKHTYENEALVWLRQIESNNRPWAGKMRGGYEAWLHGQEMPVNGIPIRTWPALSPAEAANLVALNIMTVEDLANLDENGLRRIGPGGRAQQNKARAFLQAASGPGKVAEELTALRARVEALETELAAREDVIRRLQARREAADDGPDAEEIAEKRRDALAIGRESLARKRAEAAA